MLNRSLCLLPPLALLAGMSLSACGGSSSGFSEDSSTSTEILSVPTWIGELQLTAPRDPEQATIAVTLRGRPGVRQVSFLYEVEGSLPRILEGLASNPVDLGTGDPGVVHRLRWDFRSEESWNGDDGLRRHVTLTARVQGAEELEARLEGISVGNDAPRLMLEELDTSGESLVSVSFSLSDSSDDEVDVFAEFDLVDDLPDAGWRRASHWGASGRYDGSRSCSARGPAVMQ